MRDAEVGLCNARQQGTPHPVCMRHGLRGRPGIPRSPLLRQSGQGLAQLLQRFSFVLPHPHLTAASVLTQLGVHEAEVEVASNVVPQISPSSTNPSRHKMLPAVRKNGLKMHVDEHLASSFRAGPC